MHALLRIHRLEKEMLSMANQVQQLLDAVARSTTLSESTLTFVNGVIDTLKQIRTDVASGSGNTAQIDQAIAQLNAESNKVAAALTANTLVAGVLEHETPPPPIVDPNTVPPAEPPAPPAVVAPPIVDPNTVPAPPAPVAAPAPAPAPEPPVAATQPPATEPAAETPPTVPAPDAAPPAAEPAPAPAVEPSDSTPAS